MSDLKIKFDQNCLVIDTEGFEDKENIKTLSQIFHGYHLAYIIDHFEKIDIFNLDSPVRFFNNNKVYNWSIYKEEEIFILEASEEETISTEDHSIIENLPLKDNNNNRIDNILKDYLGKSANEDKPIFQLPKDNNEKTSLANIDLADENSKQFGFDEGFIQQMGELVITKIENDLHNFGYNTIHLQHILDLQIYDNFKEKTITLSFGFDNFNKKERKENLLEINTRIQFEGQDQSYPMSFLKYKCEIPELYSLKNNNNPWNTNTPQNKSIKLGKIIKGRILWLEHFLKESYNSAKNNFEISLLKQSNMELKEFAHIASHDLREPVRLVSNYLEILSDTELNLSPTGKNYLEKSRKSITRLQRMLASLLDFSRLGGVIINKENLNLNKLLRQIFTELNEETQEKRTIKFDLGILPNIYSDKTIFWIAFKNLIENAIKFSHFEHPKIQIYSVPGNEYNQIHILNNGIPIGDKSNHKVFECFKRMENSLKKPGNGMGLSITKRALEKADCKIYCKTLSNQNLNYINYTMKFIIELPNEIIQEVKKAA